MRMILWFIIAAVFSVSSISARADGIHQTIKLVPFPSTLVPGPVMVESRGVVYGLAEDFTKNAKPNVGNSVFRISKEGALTFLCANRQVGLGANIVFDRQGNGYTLTVGGVLRFSPKGDCRIIARFGPDLDIATINGELTISPSETLFGSTRTGKLFFVDFAHGTTRTFASLPFPPNAPNAFLTDIAADPEHEGTLGGTFVWVTADGSVKSQLFTYKLFGGYKNIYLFSENVSMMSVLFVSHDRFVASFIYTGYLLSSSGRVLSDKVSAQDFPIALKEDHLFYTYEVTTAIPTNPPSRYPVLKTNIYIGRSRLDGSDQQNVADISAFGMPICAVLPGSHGKYYVAMSPSGGPFNILIASSGDARD
jgi:hypothetical protein